MRAKFIGIWAKVLWSVLLLACSCVSHKTKKTHYTSTELRLVYSRIDALEKSFSTSFLEKLKSLKKVLASTPIKTVDGYKEALKKIGEFRKASEYAFLARLRVSVKELVQLLDLQSFSENDSQQGSSSSSTSSLETFLHSQSSMRPNHRKRSAKVYFVPPVLEQRRHAKAAGSATRHGHDYLDRYLAGIRKKKTVASRRNQRDYGDSFRERSRNLFNSEL